MEKAKKVTKAQRFEDIKALLTGEDVKYGTDVDTALEVIDHELELLAKKNSSGDKKPTATQLENVEHKNRIKEFLSAQSEGVTVTTILKGVPEFAEFSNQKVARLCRDLCDSNEVVKAVVKGKSLFSIA